MTNTDLLQELERELRGRGVTLLGCGNLLELPAEDRRDLPRGISIGVALDRDIVAGIDRGPTEAYAAEYRRLNVLLEKLGAWCAQFLEERGHRTLSLAPTYHLPRRHPVITALPHKTVATRAGIGWVGKCALLVTESHGAAVRYTTVLTDAPLPVGDPLSDSRCGECSACVQACPVGAVRGPEWRVGVPREVLYDAQACRQKAREFAAGLGIDQPLCGICIAACPYTRRYLAELSSNCAGGNS